MNITLNQTDYYAYTANHAPVDDRDTVVFIHGTSMDHSVFSHQSRYFAYHGYNLLALDLPGHGRSNGDLLADIQSMGEWVNDIIGASVGQGFHLVGHSMGALVALEAAANYRDTAPPLRSLNLIGFSYPMAVTDVLMNAAVNDPSAAYSMMTQWSHTSNIGGEPVPGFWSAGMQLSMMENADPRAVAVDLEACDSYQGGEQAFERVSCPTLFICGQLDRMAPAKLAKTHADRHANAEISFIPRCGHSIMSESPDGVLSELKRFIGQHRTA